MYDEIALRLPNKVGDKARAAALTRLKLEDDSALYVAIAKQRVSDNAVLEALVPGITAEMKTKPGKLAQGAAVSIAGLTPGVAYQLADCCHPVPGDRIVGLSRLARVVEIFAHRLQTQEALTGDIADAIETALKPKGVAVMMSAEHQCMSMRGVRQRNVATISTRFLGTFETNEALRTRFISLISAPR